MNKPAKILLQTTIPYTEDDWHIGRFSLLKKHLESLKDADEQPLYEVTARDRANEPEADDPVLSTIDTSDFDELWMFAVDTGNGLSKNECSAITRFRRRGGGILSTRDHFDLGSSLCTIGGIGPAHFFHSKNNNPDPDRRSRDDEGTQSIDWPNYHSGANGDFQKITATEPHELLRRADGSTIEYFPAHPHEGDVGAPDGDPAARVVATGKSQATGRPFNLVVAFEQGPGGGRGIAESSFHHLVDYNWDTDKGCPTFLEEPPGDGYKRDPAKLDDVKAYVSNAAKWLAG